MTLKQNVPPWDYIKDNYQPDDLVAIGIKHANGRYTQRIVTASAAATPNFQRWLRFENFRGGDLYLSVNSIRPEASGRRKENIQAIRHIYLDIDRNGQAVVDKLLNHPRLPRPSYVLNTSPDRYQVLWKVEGFTQEQAQKLTKALANELGADATVHDIARVLRLPGFYNNKPEYREHHQVTADKLSTDVSKPADFHIPVPEMEHKTQASAHTPDQHRDKNPDHSPSGRDWAYVNRKLEQGVHPDKIIQAVAAYRSDKPGPEYYARHTVEQALVHQSQKQPSEPGNREPEIKRGVAVGLRPGDGPTLSHHKSEHKSCEPSPG